MTTKYTSHSDTHLLSLRELYRRRHEPAPVDLDAELSARGFATT